MDWSGCELVETVSDGASSVPFIRGTHISADAILNDLQQGVRFEALAARHPSIPVEAIREILTYGLERAGWDTKTLVNWRGCALVEQVPGRYSGAPTILNTRIPPDIVAEYYWSGATVAEIREDYPSLSEETILGLIEYVRSQEASAA
ncbi:Uncharacterized conserved protein, DUF433 family [Granulicella rosea]|uniref:Uncharacterized conserved protein, DUF433 family n=1 Tax=Granulicella rosea TaxID=474952 RepID=A0A239IRJ6_9BACT|nr:DUF433 domain-containing protein [Granulicella rosea]SNS95703.1 Uncharacterized conserved protein, DUF433 family [Granulicella rosea]